MATVILRKVQVNDLERIIAIEHSVQPVPWSRNGLFNEFFTNPVGFWALCPTETLSEIIGYICFRIVVDEVYLSNIAIANRYQGLGYGSFLLKSAMHFWKNRGIKRVSLDVYKQNHQAISFYTRNGFFFACSPDKVKGKFCVMEMKLLQE